MGSAVGTAGPKNSWLYWPNSLWTWYFFIVAVVQAIIALVLEASVFAQFRQDSIPRKPGDSDLFASDARTIPTYLALLIFAFIYQLLLVYDALRAKNTIQVIGLVAMNVAILIYTSIQYDQVLNAYRVLQSLNRLTIDFWSHVRPYLIALPIITAVGTVCLVLGAWKLYEEFAWTIYKQINTADVKLKNSYLMYQIYIAILKFDFFLFLGFIIQFLVIVHNTSDAEFYLTVAALPIVLVLLFLAAWSTRRENVMGTCTTILFYFISLAYFIFKLVRMYAASNARQQEYKPARKTLTVFAAITIVFLLGTIVIACLCARNFNTGLRPHISRRDRLPENREHTKFTMGDMNSHKYSDSTGTSNWPTSSGGPSGGHRMEID